ncbi:acyl-CoA dehydrogenase C-terminal domain-containing protein [Variovorax guangxiensis]|uniref:acyl-CoA dehydrogenase C-terminal domain-containing protein n=1 Tax=Variovorax guangxiensis TaxID=1775474 RepID=UPI00285FC584|nr:acyl-CoA dehydrogenase C-terminal domain-containing protein [Variovorax guangxiensis]MDR6858544.1 alkylation response protein AidB-like acyl-CoA dehydrogenase [Variovorax guangxiensis]
MATYKSPVQDYLFLLNDVFHIERHTDVPGYAELSPDLVEATLTEAAKLCDNVLAPLNRVGDSEGCTRHEDGSVTTPSGFKEAFDQFRDGGWNGLKFPEEYGGQGLPSVLAGVLTEFLSGSNLSFWMYSGLTQGAVAALLRHASDDLKRLYVPKMVACEWTGTMNLTEPHAGTDLGLLRTRATRQADGSFAITGTKIFISAGEHDLAENIVHLVLARIEGAPSGTHGISLFLVPKFIPAADGSLGSRNAASCGSIEHKMGIHGNSTCVMNFDGATGWLVGEENRGLNALFTMMNEARLGTGMHGIAIGEAAYQNAAAYAHERLQGRALAGRKTDKPADPIVVHGDVRRMLMTMRATTEGARALAVWTGIQVDLAARAADPAVREAAEDHLALLTPVIKAYSTDTGFASAVMAQQIFGGHGYIVENGMEQFVRDARINQIYEGANGVQAMDLVGRKLGLNGGKPMKAFVSEVEAWLHSRADKETLAVHVKALEAGLGDLTQAALWLAKHAGEDPEVLGACAYDFLNLFGLVVLGYMWGRMCEVAGEKLAGSMGQAGQASAHLSAKLAVGRFYAERMLPETAMLLARIKTGAGATMALSDEAF